MPTSHLPLACALVAWLAVGPLRAEAFELAGGEVVAGDVVWVRATSLELMPDGLAQVRSIPLATLNPESRYLAERHRRALTGEPSYLALARAARAWGLLDAAREELAGAARLSGIEVELDAEWRALQTAEAERDLAAAQSAIGRGELAAAGGLLERVAASGAPGAAATAQGLLNQHSAAIASARAALQGRMQERRRVAAEKRLARARSRALEALEDAQGYVAAGDAARGSLAGGGTSISHSRWTLLDAARLYTLAANECAAAGDKLPEGDEVRARLETEYQGISARLADSYCDLGEMYLVRSNLIEAYEWAAVALALDPQSTRAETLRKTALLGGALSGYGGHGGWGHGGWDGGWSPGIGFIGDGAGLGLGLVGDPIGGQPAAGDEPAAVGQPSTDGSFGFPPAERYEPPAPR